MLAVFNIGLIWRSKVPQIKCDSTQNISCGSFEQRALIGDAHVHYAYKFQIGSN